MSGQVRGIAPRTAITLDDVRAWPVVVDIATASKALGISRSYGFELATRGEFPARVITVGTAQRVVTASLLAPEADYREPDRGVAGTVDDIRNGPPTLDIPTASRALGISPSYGFKLAKRGEFPCRVIQVGSKPRVVTASLLALLDDAREAG